MISKLPKRITDHFPAFKHKNYRLYFTGQLISFSGSWLHGIAQGWLIYQLTHSAFWLGAISAISALPVLTFSLFGGFLVDRFNRKKILILTQGASLLLALVLGILTLTGFINLHYLIIITLLSGIVSSLDNPASQSFLADIVSKEDLPSAIGLNSTIFNAGRVIGPAGAGFLIAFVGIGNVFLINAASFLAILFSLYFIKANVKINRKNDRPFTAIKEGVSYSFAHPLISLLLFTAAIGAVFCFSQVTIMPILAEQVFSKGTQGLGYLLSAMGLGAITGSLIISSQFKKMKALKFIMAGNLIFLISTFIFSFTSNIHIASLLLFISGLGLTLQFSSIYATIQRLVKEEFRGRVSSIYVLLFVGLSALGNLFVGTIASWLGPQIAIRTFTLIVFLYSSLVYLNLSHVRASYKKYQEKIQPAF